MFDYKKELARYFKSIGGDGFRCNAVKCENCMFHDECGSNDCDTDAVRIDYVGKVYEKVKQWSIDHPQKTILQDLLEKYPNVKLDKSGVPRDFCPNVLGVKNLEECFSKYMNKDWLTCWYLGLHPNGKVIEISYSEDFAKRFGRTNKRRGTMISRGILSGVTGNGANLIIIDDPVKTQQEADSESSRSRPPEEF